MCSEGNIVVLFSEEDIHSVSFTAYRASQVNHYPMSDSRVMDKYQIVEVKCGMIDSL